MKCLSDQLDKKIIIINKPNNNHILIIKKSDFLNLTDIISSKINNLLKTPVDLDSIVFLNNRI